ncbi:MAG: hypothetical protein IPJ32_21695 [Sphingobacteriaceae bacterium]|nr:hypothetical protein [Sphingobacteriaceae bacterium]
MGQEPDISRPANRFTVNDDIYLELILNFECRYKNPSDSLETKYYALKLMQDVIRFHQNDNNPDV